MGKITGFIPEADAILPNNCVLDIKTTEKKALVPRSAPELLRVTMNANQIRQACIDFAIKRTSVSLADAEMTCQKLSDITTVDVVFTAKPKKRVRKAKTVTP